MFGVTRTCLCWCCLVVPFVLILALNGFVGIINDNNFEICKKRKCVLSAGGRKMTLNLYVIFFVTFNNFQVLELSVLVVLVPVVDTVVSDESVVVELIQTKNE